MVVLNKHGSLYTVLQLGCFDHMGCSGIEQQQQQQQHCECSGWLLDGLHCYWWPKGKIIH